MEKKIKMFASKICSVIVAYDTQIKGSGKNKISNLDEWQPFPEITRNITIFPSFNIYIYMLIYILYFLKF